jgi:hypothetical protein
MATKISPIQYEPNIKLIQTASTKIICTRTNMIIQQSQSDCREDCHVHRVLPLSPQFLGSLTTAKGLPLSSRLLFLDQWNVPHSAIDLAWAGFGPRGRPGLWVRKLGNS